MDVKPLPFILKRFSPNRIISVTNSQRYSRSSFSQVNYCSHGTLCVTLDTFHTWSFRPWWGMGAHAVTRLQRSGRPWHDGVIAAHWQSVCERGSDVYNLFYEADIRKSSKSVFLSAPLCVIKIKTCFLSTNCQNCTFVVEDALHLHGGPGVGNTEHGARHQTLQGRGAVCGPYQTPVWPFMAALQDLHRLTSPHSQLIVVAGHEVMYHHSQLTATGQLKERRWSLQETSWADSVRLTAEHVQVLIYRLPCRCPVCSVKCGMPERWCLVGCCLHPDCPGPLHP